MSLNEDTPVTTDGNIQSSARGSARPSVPSTGSASAANADQPAQAEEPQTQRRSRPECSTPRTDHSSLPVRQYLDRTVTPILLHGLEALARDRPEDPITYLAAFLLKNKNRAEEIFDDNS